MKFTPAILCMFLSLSGSFAMADAASEAQPVGKVIFATGGASLQPEAGAAVQGQTGTPVYEGEMLSTGAGSHMHVQMMDGALLVLRPESAIRIAYYHVDLAQPANTKILLDMQKGVIRSVTGKGGKANKQGFRLNTPVAAIGIKGTDFTVLADANLSSVTLREGGVAVSPFSSVCQRYAVGACSGAQTVMLTAADQQMLAEVHAAKAVLVPKTSAVAVPDTIAPAHPEEVKSLKESKEAPVTSSQSATPAATTGSTTQASQTASSSTPSTQTNAATGTATSATTATTPTAGTVAVKAGSTLESTSGLTGGSAATEKTTNSPDSTKLALISSSEAALSSMSNLSGSIKETAMGGATAEVASLASVAAEVGPKESVTSELASRVVAEKTLGETVDTVLTPAPVPVVTSIPAKPQPFFWGRWASYAENPEQVIVRDPVKNKQIFAANQVYLLADGEAGAPQLPKSGKVTFALDKGEAGILAGDRLVSASISNASLEANFDNNRFKTGLTVNSDVLKNGAVALQAEGGLSPGSGVFRSDSVASNMNVSGAFSDNADHAGYEFSDPANNIVGVTTWNR